MYLHTNNEDSDYEDSFILEKIELLREVGSRDPENQKEQRKAYLAQAARMKQVFPVTVSENVNGRHKHWKEQFQQIFSRKEPKPMFYPILSILIALTLLFGGGAAAVSASQDSLPGQPLWALKSWSEEAQLKYNSSPMDRLELQLRFTQRRMEEIRRMVELGVEPPGDMVRIMERQMDRTMEQAVLLDESELIPAFEMIRNRWQFQEREMTQLMENQPDWAEALLNQIRLTLQERLRFIGASLEDPEQLRLWLRVREQFQLQESNNSGEEGQNSFGPNWGDQPENNGQFQWQGDNAQTDHENGPFLNQKQIQNEGDSSQNQVGEPGGPQQNGDPEDNAQNTNSDDVNGQEGSQPDQPGSSSGSGDETNQADPPKSEPSSNPDPDKGDGGSNSSSTSGQGKP